jgi:hypothetical protein
MRKLILQLDEPIFDKLQALVLANQKSFSRIVTEIFEQSKEAQEIYDQMINQEYEKICGDNNEPANSYKR